VKDSPVYRVAPNRDLESWKVVREGDKQPCAKGLTKQEAIKQARKLAEKSAPGTAFVLVHKTRYIIGKSLQFPS
jgi:hypothetical protein